MSCYDLNKPYSEELVSNLMDRIHKKLQSEDFEVISAPRTYEDRDALLIVGDIFYLFGFIPLWPRTWMSIEKGIGGYWGNWIIKGRLYDEYGPVSFTTKGCALNIPLDGSIVFNAGESHREWEREYRRKIIRKEEEEYFDR
jgi:hypothetical protein